MAGWDQYVDSIITNSKGNCDKAGLIGLGGGEPWTTAHNGAGISLQGSEGATIANCMAKKDYSSFQMNGVFAEGKKYRFLRDEDDKLVLAKLKEHGALTIQRTKTAVILAHTKEGAQQGEVNKQVAAIADYLESQNM